MTVESKDILVRRGTAAQWAATSHVMLSGELGWETTNDILKVGDGVSLWAALPTLVPVLSVAGKTGAVSLVKADVGLGSVDNTADTAKPVSTAQSTADNLRMLKTANGSDIASVATFKTNLGIGNIVATIQSQGVAVTTTQPTLNFGPEFVLTNTGGGGSGSTNVGLLPVYRMRTGIMELTPGQSGAPAAGSVASVTNAFITLPANGTGSAQEYDFEVRIRYESTTANDILLDWSFPTSCTCEGGYLGTQSGATGNAATLNNIELSETTTSRLFGGIGTGTGNSMRTYASFTVFVPAGNAGGAVQLQAGANAGTDVAAGSTRILSVTGTAVRAA